MAIQFVSGSTARGQFNFSNPSLSVDVGSGSDRLLVVGIALRGSQDANITAITYGGVSLALATSTSFTNSLRTWIYYLVNPAAGSNTLAVTFDSTSNRQFEVQAAAFVGVNQDTPLDDFGPATGNSNAPSVTLEPTEDDELLFGFCIHEGNNANSTGSGETTLFNNDNGAWVTSSSYAIQTTATSQSVDWTNGQSDNWHAVAASFKVAADANTSPSVALETADEATLGATPTLAFTGTDADGDDIRYNVQVSENPDFDLSDGVNIVEEYTGVGGGASVHPQAIGGTTWQGNPNIDDRPGQSFRGVFGVLDQIRLELGDFRAETSGTAYVRVYEAEGTFGVSSAPLNAAGAADTPTPGWLAISDGLLLDSSDTTGDYFFQFSGEDRIHLDPNAEYIWILDWVPDDTDNNNTFAVQGDASVEAHEGNGYIDGNSAPNHGVQTWDFYFGVYADVTLLDKVSGTDAGFVNEDDGGDSDPFTSGQTVSFTVQAGDALEDSVTYFWRVRGIDPAGSGLYGDWATARSFTVVSTPGGVTVTPAPAVASGGVVAPAVIQGSITFDPASIAAGGGTIVPTIVLGNITLTPEVAAALAATIAPSLAFSSVSILPAPGQSGASTVGPSVVLGSIALSPAVMAAVAAAVDPSVSLGDVAITPEAIEARSLGVDPTVILGNIVLGSAVVEARALGIDPTVDLNGIIFTPDAVEAASAGIAPAVVLGSTSITPDAIEARALGVDPSVQEEGDLVTPSPVAAATVAITPAVQLGSISITPDPSSVAAAAVAPTVMLGSISITPVSVVAQGTTIDPTVILSGLLIIPTQAEATATALDPTVAGDDTIIVMPGPVSVQGGAVEPIVMLGSVAVDPSATEAGALTGQPGVLVGDVVIVPVPVEIGGGGVDPEVVSGAIFLLPGPVESGAGSGDPTLELSSVTVTPVSVVARTAAGDAVVLSAVRIHSVTIVFAPPGMDVEMVVPTAASFSGADIEVEADLG